MQENLVSEHILYYLDIPFVFVSAEYPVSKPRENQYHSCNQSDLYKYASTDDCALTDCSNFLLCKHAILLRYKPDQQHLNWNKHFDYQTPFPDIATHIEDVLSCEKMV